VILWTISTAIYLYGFFKSKYRSCIGKHLLNEGDDKRSMCVCGGGGGYSVDVIVW
jgi:hypothetical protein